MAADDSLGVPHCSAATLVGVALVLSCDYSSALIIQVGLFAFPSILLVFTRTKGREAETGKEKIDSRPDVTLDGSLAGGNPEMEVNTTSQCRV